jgi:hypothetical protein
VLVGTSGFTTREDVLLATTSPDADKPQNAATVEMTRQDWPQWRAP